MTNYYFIIIAKDDYYRYGLFLGNSLQYSNRKVWGLLKNTVKDIWNSISEDDVIIFGNEDFNFKHFSKIKKKIVVENDVSERIFGTSYRAKELKHLLLFDEISKTKFTFSEMKKFVDIKLNPSHGVFQVKNPKSMFLKKFQQNDQGKIDIPLIDVPEKSTLPNQKTRSTTVFERDSKLVLKLKKEYKNICQVCGYKIQKSNGEYYSEVHHFWPLQYGGEDTKNNMLVLCPNHHKEFDLCSIALLDDGNSIINQKKEVKFHLTFLKGHKIDKKNIDFHLNRFDEQ